MQFCFGCRSSRSPRGQGAFKCATVAQTTPRTTAALAGDREDALRWKEKLKAMLEQNPGAAVQLAVICSALGEKDEAVSWLQRAFDGGGIWFLAQLKVEPMFQPLREDPRFEAMQEQGTGCFSRQKRRCLSRGAREKLPVPVSVRRSAAFSTTVSSSTGSERAGLAPGRPPRGRLKSAQRPGPCRLRAAARRSTESPARSRTARSPPRAASALR